MHSQNGILQSAGITCIPLRVHYVFSTFTVSPTESQPFGSQPASAWFHDFHA